MNSNEQKLVDYVKKAIRAGATYIRVPSYLINGIGRDVLQGVKELCQVNGVEISIEV